MDSIDDFEERLSENYNPEVGDYLMPARDNGMNWESSRIIDKNKPHMYKVNYDDRWYAVLPKDIQSFNYTECGNKMYKIIAITQMSR
jgi:hypothetical protein